MKKTLIALLSGIFISGFALAINCKRNLSVMSAKEMKVEIIVNKQDISGFAKLAELIPEGAVIKYAKSEGGSVDIADNKMNFFWLTLPEEKEIKVTYILSTEKLTDGNYSIAGKFSYVEENAPHSVAIDPSTFSVSAASGIILAPLPAATALVENTTIGTEKAGKVLYGVQLMSTTKALPDNYFSKKYNLTEKVKVSNEKGQLSYVMGEFSDLQTALDFRQTVVKKGLSDSFVIAILNNKQISLKEAKEREGTSK